MAQLKKGDFVRSRTIDLALIGVGIVTEELEENLYAVEWPNGDSWYKHWEWDIDDLEKVDEPRV